MPFSGSLNQILEFQSLWQQVLKTLIKKEVFHKLKKKKKDNFKKELLKYCCKNIVEYILEITSKSIKIRK